MKVNLEYSSDIGPTEENLDREDQLLESDVEPKTTPVAKLSPARVETEQP